MSEAGFEIGGRFYPLPAAFRLGDPVLATEVTGMGWDEFVQAMQDETGDPRVSAGLVAIAVWQGNPTWRRDKVVRYVEQLDLAALDFRASDGEQGDDAGPPEPTTPTSEPGSTSGSGDASATSSSKPSATQASGSAPTPASGGDQASATG